MTGGTWAAMGLVATISAWINVVHLVGAPRRDWVAPVGVVAAGAAGWAWLAATTSPWAGLAAAGPWALGVASTAGVVVAVARARPGVAARFGDRRIRAMGPGEFRRHVWIRIPLLVALPEEVPFRGVAWTLLARSAGGGVATVASAVAFGCAHVVVARDQARREGHGVAGWVVATVGATTLAGLAFAGLRWSTGGIWASMVVHAGINATSAWVARGTGRPPRTATTKPT